MKYTVCEKCGASLDHGEPCDCTKNEKFLEIVQNKRSESEKNQTHSNNQINQENIITKPKKSQEQISELPAVPVKAPNNYEDVIPKDIIVIGQLPVIEERLIRLSEHIKQRTSVAETCECTEDNYKDVKKLRAEFNKEHKSLKEQYTEIMDRVLAPIKTVDKRFAICAQVYKDADEKLKSKISTIETGIKDAKKAEVIEYFNEAAKAVNIDFLSFEDLGITVSMSASLKSLKDKTLITLNKIAEDLKMIDTQDFKDEILVEYKSHLNVSKAITDVCERHKRIEDEKKQRLEAQAERELKEEAKQKALEAAAEMSETKEPINAPLTPPSSSDIPIVADNTNTTDIKPTKKPLVAYIKVWSPEVERLREFKYALEEAAERIGVMYEFK